MREFVGVDYGDGNDRSVTYTFRQYFVNDTPIPKPIEDVRKDLIAYGKQLDEKGVWHNVIGLLYMLDRLEAK